MTAEPTPQRGLEATFLFSHCSIRAIRLRATIRSLRECFLIGLMAVGINAQAQDAAVLRLVQTIPLPNVEGRIDHMAVDVKGERLFIAALGNNTVEVLDLRAGKRMRSLTGFHEPQDVAFIPELNKLFVANARDGACDLIDGSTFKPLKRINFADDADNIRYDTKNGGVYVGYGSGALGIIDAASGEQVGAIKLDGHPESFQLEKSGPRIFVNVPNAQKITLVDRDKAATIGSWSLKEAQSNFPMALDETHHRLFIGARRPAKLLVFDTRSGKLVADLTSPGDADDIFYDESRQRIYISGGEGSIGIIQQQDADHYRPAAKIATAPGARTSLFVPELSRLYLAVPHRGSQPAEVRVYEAVR